MADKQPGSGLLRKIGSKALADRRDQQQRLAEAEAARRLSTRHAQLMGRLEGIFGRDWPRYYEQLKEQLRSGQARVEFDGTLFEVPEPGEERGHEMIATAICPTCDQPFTRTVADQADLGEFYEQYDKHQLACVDPAVREIAARVQRGG